jgi:hypothetical protein
MFHRDGLCEVVMLPLQSLAWQLHDGSTVIVACWYSLDDHVMASVCVCIQCVYSLA